MTSLFAKFSSSHLILVVLMSLISIQGVMSMRFEIVKVLLVACAVSVGATAPDCPPHLPIPVTGITVDHTTPRRYHVTILGTLVGASCIQGPLTLTAHVAFAGLPVHTTSGDACLATTCPLCPGPVQARPVAATALSVKPHRAYRSTCPSTCLPGHQRAPTR